MQKEEKATKKMIQITMQLQCATGVGTYPTALAM